MSFVPLPSFRPNSVSGVVYNRPSVWENALASAVGGAVGTAVDQFIDQAITTQEEKALADLRRLQGEELQQRIDSYPDEQALKQQEVAARQRGLDLQNQRLAQQAEAMRSDEFSRQLENLNFALGGNADMPTNNVRPVTGGEIAAKVAEKNGWSMDDPRTIAEVQRQLKRYNEIAPGPEELQPYGWKDAAKDFGSEFIPNLINPMESVKTMGELGLDLWSLIQNKDK